MKIIFPCTNRVHLARQKLLLEELSKIAVVEIADISHVALNEASEKMSSVAGAYAVEFNKFLEKENPDLVLIRGDRYEQLPLAMMASYRGIPIAHIEAGDLSGVIDNKVRFAISHLADLHFATNSESEVRLLGMGFKEVFNMGSLDCEYAMDVQPHNLYSKSYILVLWHPVLGEDSNELYEAIKDFENDYKIVGIQGNHDYGEHSNYKENFKPDDFVNLLRYAECAVGNSSCLLKEISVLGTPSVVVGSRQANRLRPDNVIDVACKKQAIIDGINKQLFHGTYPLSFLYYKPETSKKICQTLLDYFSDIDNQKNLGKQ